MALGISKTVVFKKVVFVPYIGVLHVFLFERKAFKRFIGYLTLDIVGLEIILACKFQKIIYRCLRVFMSFYKRKVIFFHFEKASVLRKTSLYLNMFFLLNCV